MNILQSLILVSLKSRTMSEKRPDLELDEEMKRKLKLDGAASGSAANQETLKSKLKPAREKGNQDKEMKKTVKFDPAASGSVSTQETLKPAMERRNQGKMSEKIPTSVSDKDMKRKVRFDQSAGRSVAKQETLKPPAEKGNLVHEDSLKATMGERSSTYSSSPRSSSSSSSKDKAPTLILAKSLTYRDLLTGKLSVPSTLFLSKKREGIHDRIMIPFRDNNGELWELEATSEGLSLNWHKFVVAHGLRYNDLIFIYDDGPESEFYLIEYARSGPEVQSRSRFSPPIVLIGSWY